MKTILTLFILCFSLGGAFAQDVNKSIYIANGDLVEATLYHDNGVIAQTGFYNKANRLQGEWISFDEAGNKTAVAQYEDGNKVGTWFFYQGESLKEVIYSDSKIAGVKTYKQTNTQIVSN